MKKAFAPSVSPFENPIELKKLCANVENIWLKDGEMRFVNDDYIVYAETFDEDHFEDDDERQAVEDRLLEFTKAKYGENVEQIGWNCGEDMAESH